MADDLINLRIDQLPLNGILKGTYFLAIRNMDTQKTERVPLSAFLTSGTTNNFEWVTDNDPGYAEDDVVTYGGKWWQSLLNDNLNIVPGTNPLAWIELTSSPSGFVFWQAGVFPQDEVFVLYEITPGSVQIYRLIDPTRPYLSSDFETELAAGDWQIISEGQTHFKGTYANEAALDAAHPTAEPGDYALVDVGSSDAQLFIWDETDTEWIASGVTTVVPPWDNTTPGLVERSTTAEAQNIVTRTAAGSSDASNSDLRAPSEKGLVEMLLSFLGGAWTWAAKQIFTLAPRFSSTTASQFLKVDSSKDLISVAPATQSEMITGTDNDKPATAQSVEKKRTIKRALVSGPGSGNTLTIDCGGAQEVKIYITDTINYNFTIGFSNNSNLEMALLIMASITGTCVITISTSQYSSPVMQKNETSAGVWNNSTKAATIAAGTTESIEMSFDVITSSKLHIKLSDLYHAS